MRGLSGTKKIVATAGALLLIATATGSALAMIDSDRLSRRLSVPVQPAGDQGGATTRGVRPQDSPLPTSTPDVDDEVEFRGTLEVMATTGWVISGRTVQVTSATEIGEGVEIGATVKVHAVRQTDGSLLAREIELSSPGDDDDNSNGNGNENDNDNDNENENENENENVNSNDNDDDDDDDDNGNSNDNDDDDNGNGNGNSNDNDDDDNGNGNGHSNDNGNGNVNSNDNDDDDDDNGNGNSNDHDDEDDDNSNTNGN